MTWYNANNGNVCVVMVCCYFHLVPSVIPYSRNINKFIWKCIWSQWLCGTTPHCLVHHNDSLLPTSNLFLFTLSYMPSLNNDMYTHHVHTRACIHVHNTVHPLIYHIHPYVCIYWCPPCEMSSINMMVCIVLAFCYVLGIKCNVISVLMQWFVCIIFPQLSPTRQ